MESASQLGEVHVIFLLSFLAGTVLAMVGYAQARSFVTRRLRYVDAVHTAFAPFIAGIAAALIASPIVAIVPYVGAGTALSFGIAVGAGVAAGSRDVRRRLPTI
jgi:predicted lysophospholipase L1 biosynthesis ABC-type transport system permease subunit